MTAKYILGIDLGTTNSVLAYVPVTEERAQVELLPIPQLVAARTVESRSALPSFLYLASQHESDGGTYETRAATSIVHDLRSTIYKSRLPI